MTAPRSAAARRLILVPAETRSARSDPVLRRFRFARLQLEGRDAARAERLSPARRFPTA